jgi:hypothetical protein
MTEGLSASLPWNKAPIWGLSPDFYYLRVCWNGTLSLGRVCHLQFLLVLASAVILGSESRGLATIFYCLRFETSLFVASYDLQDYGGGIRQSQSQSQSHVTTDGQSASMSWNKAPVWGLRPDLDYYQTVVGLLMWDENVNILRKCLVQVNFEIYKYLSWQIMAFNYLGYNVGCSNTSILIRLYTASKIYLHVEQ